MNIIAWASLPQTCSAQTVQKMLATQYTVVFVVYPHRPPDWELWLLAAAQHHKRLSYCVLLAWKKTRIQTL